MYINGCDERSRLADERERKEAQTNQFIYFPPNAIVLLTEN